MSDGEQSESYIVTSLSNDALLVALVSECNGDPTTEYALQRDAILQSITHSNRTTTIGLLAISLAFFMIVLDTTVVNAALPLIGTQLQGTLASLEWIANSYTLVFASLLLTAGAFGDRFGTKAVFQGGLALFALASTACASATSLPVLIGARAVQGIGAAAMMPCSLALIAHLYPDAKARAKAYGIWAGVSGLAIAAGPFVGGYLVDAQGWRSVFYVNVPIAVAAMALTARYAPSAPRLRKPSVDALGQLLAVILLIALTFSAIEGPHTHWGNGSRAALALAILSGLAFGAVERRAAHPMVPPVLLRRAPTRVAILVGGTLNFGLYGTLFALSLYLQQARHFSALKTGAAFLPLTLAMWIFVVLSGRLTARFGPRWPMTGGLILQAIAAGLLTLLPSHGYGTVSALGLLLFGTGFGLAMPAMTATMVAGAPRSQAGIASGVLSAGRQVGGVLGVAVLGAATSSTFGLQCGFALIMLLALLSAAASATQIGPDDASDLAVEGKGSGHRVAELCR